MKWQPIDDYLARNGDVHTYELELTRQTTDFADGTRLGATYGVGKDTGTGVRQVLTVNDPAAACTPHPDDSSSECVYTLEQDVARGGMNYSVRVRTRVLVGGKAVPSNWSRLMYAVAADRQPSGAPVKVHIVTAGSTSFRVACERPEERHRNGAITGFRVAWRRLPASQNSDDPASWAGGEELCKDDSKGGGPFPNGTQEFACLFDDRFAADTKYEMSVAALTSAGVGSYSTPVTRWTSFAKPIGFTAYNAADDGTRLSLVQVTAQPTPRVVLSWTAAGDASGSNAFVIRYCAGATATTSDTALASGEGCGQTGVVRGTNHTLVDLVPYTQYAYTIMQVSECAAKPLWVHTLAHIRLVGCGIWSGTFWCTFWWPDC